MRSLFTAIREKIPLATTREKSEQQLRLSTAKKEKKKVSTVHEATRWRYEIVRWISKSKLKGEVRAGELKWGLYLKHRTRRGHLGSECRSRREPRTKAWVTQTFRG